MARYTIRATDDETVYCETIEVEDPKNADREGRLHLAAAWDIEIPDDDPDAMVVEEATKSFVVDPAPEVDAMIALMDAARALVDGTSDDPFEDLRSAVHEAERYRSLY